jgi:hypothetical protein
VRRRDLAAARGAVGGSEVKSEIVGHEA